MIELVIDLVIFMHGFVLMCCVVWCITTVVVQCTKLHCKISTMNKSAQNRSDTKAHYCGKTMQAQLQHQIVN